MGIGKNSTAYSPKSMEAKLSCHSSEAFETSSNYMLHFSVIKKYTCHSETTRLMPNTMEADVSSLMLNVSSQDISLNSHLMYDVTWTNVNTVISYDDLNLAQWSLFTLIYIYIFTTCSIKCPTYKLENFLF